jgi:hypothetical protein
MIEARTARACWWSTAMGRIFMDPLDDPFAAVEREFTACRAARGRRRHRRRHARRGDEREAAMGYFCDGRVSLVVGTHTHAPTADHRILAGGTAFMSDVGMTGDYDSVIGMGKDEPMTALPAAHSLGGSSRRRPGDACARSRSRPTGDRAAARVAAVRLGGCLEQAVTGVLGLSSRAGARLYFLVAAPYRSAHQFIPTSRRERAQSRAMAGHSQFKNIMHRKGRQDAVKSKLFGKLAREITVRAKLGCPIPAMNRGCAPRSWRRARRTCPRTISSARSRRRPAATARTTRRSATRATARAASR